MPAFLFFLVKVKTKIIMTKLCIGIMQIKIFKKNIVLSITKFLIKYNFKAYYKRNIIMVLDSS
ncbi:hypothetical protein OSSY52_07250 [Tepiditoga spiralis]|uniref:Uncharacterized protein n=1 Tax=Tepiditoga spiralis TaxID=2108365 RepID=A0A7G1G654_9BACT|nr:hypothetical protein OSSY52_07250 [Tepiditoga spiralis]